MPGEAVTEWKRLDQARKGRNNVTKEQYHDAVDKWEMERGAARASGRKPRWKKKDFGGLEKGIPRPKLAIDGEELSSEDDDDDVIDD